MNRPHDTADEGSAPETEDAHEKGLVEGRSDPSGDLAGPGPRSGQDEDPDT